MRISTVALGALMATIAITPSALADPPSVLGEAQQGELRAQSLISVRTRYVDLRGTWIDWTLSCDQYRRIRVWATIRYSIAGRVVRTVPRARAGIVRNCAAAPRFGLRIRAAATRANPANNHPHLSLACGDGRWKPGDYAFIVQTTHRNTRLKATASLRWHNEVGC